MDRLVPPNVPLPGAPSERFLSWCLPLLSNANSNGEAAEAALLSLHEFLTACEPASIERYIISILRSCQALLEDEATPLNILRPLLGILTVLANRFNPIFEPHFADLVDLLLGWALMPDLSESDRNLITDSFLHFQKLWAGNLPFSSNLLCKFLGDMEVLAQDAIPGSLNQPRRLWALASCFVAVLRATSSGILEFGFKEESLDSFRTLLPRLMVCLGMVGQKFRSFKWLREAFTCLLLFANLFREKFSNFSCLATDFLLKSLKFDTSARVSHEEDDASSLLCACFPSLTSAQVQEILKINLELISLQGPALPCEAVTKLLQEGSSFTRLRLHPSRAVTGLVSETYLLLLRYDSHQVIQVATDCLIHELITLKKCLGNLCDERTDSQSITTTMGKEEILETWVTNVSELECRELIKYNLLLLTCSVHLMHDQLGYKSEKTFLRSKEIQKFLIGSMSPFQSPLQCYADVQLAVVQSLHRLCWLKCVKILNGNNTTSFKKGAKMGYHMCKIAISECLAGCDKVFAKALNPSASFSVKVEVLDWIGNICNEVLAADSFVACSIHKDFFQKNIANEETFALNLWLSKDVILALLIAASDREQKVRGKVATILNLLLHSRLIKPLYFKDVAEVALEHLGDTGPGIQNAFRELLAVIAPVSLWTTGLAANVYCCGSSLLSTTHGQWKKYFALRRFSRHLRPQQVVFILNYIAQQWQVLPSSWLQRLVQNLPKDMAGDFGKDAEGLLFKQGSGSVKLNQENLASPSLDINTELLERMCTNNNLATAWWAIQEAAWHCVTVRLRTHLGGPTQTFGVLERMLLDVVQSLQADNSQREGATAVLKLHSRLLPMRLLLEFVDSLRKNIYNATEGSVVLSTPSPASAHFFRANRKVCEEWFSRICEALMNASLALQCYAATYHHTTLRLHDLRSAAVTAMREMQWPQTTDTNPSNLKIKVRQDVLKTLRLATLALCRAHEPSTIRGLQIWANSTFGALISDDALLLQTGSGLYGSLGWMNGAVLQSQGHYERAATYFSKLLQSEDSLTALGADGVQFVIARTIESYVAVADWEALEIWLQELQTLRAQHAGKSYAGALTTAGHDMNSIHAFACFDAGDVPGAWAHLDLTPQSSGDLTPDPHLALQRSEQMLLQALLHLQGDATENSVKEMEKAKSILEESLVVSGFDGLTHAAPLLMHLHCIKAFEVNCSTANIRERDSSSHLTMFKSLEQLDCHPLDAFHQDCGIWLKLMRIYKAIMPHFKVSTQLQWHIIRLARKQQNFRLCHRLLNRLCNAVNLDSNSGTGYVSGEEFSPFHYEFMLLQYAEGNSQEAIIGLWNLVQGFITSSKWPDDFKKEIVAKASLKLASWIKKNPILPAGFFLQKGHDMLDDAALGKHLMLEDINLRRGDNSRFPAHSQQGVIGAAVKSAALMFPTMGKAWFAYGSWCFNLAKASFSGPNVLKYPSLFPQILNSEIVPNSSWFSDEEVNRIRAIVLDAIVNSGDATQLNLQVNLRKVSGLQVKGEFNETFIQHIVHLMQMAAGAVESDGESPSRMLSMQLKLEISGQCPGMSSLQTVAYVNNLIEIWWGLRKRRVCLYEHALDGFLKYINVSNWTDHRGGNRLAQMKHKRDQTLGASLYVLHILFNHGIELNDTLRKGISSISPSSWQEVTPQLFARLTNHPEPLVRKQLEDILSMLAQISPWAIVYPVLVSINTSDGEPPPEIQQLLGCLLKLHPKLVKDVQLLIAELGGITVLWEERWMSTLQDLRSDVIRRITLLKEEALRLTEDNAHMSMEKPNINGSKYSASMLPVISTLERLISITTRPPKTAHESWFQQHYIPQIKDAISGFKSPMLNISSLNDVWRPFDSIVASLASHVKRSVVPLDDIAPRLVFVGSSDVPIPGLEKQVGLAHGESPLGGIPEMVTLTAFHKEVQLLATKTKPKKLAMIGSDGQTYTYLLKGHEDLRLDARIMQLLRAVNKMLSSYSSSRGGHLVARHYSVTPISGQAGLIQWVDNLVSMYAVFKAWQQRNHSAQYANPGHANMPVPPAIPRPSDMFYGKMIPALKERGLRKVMSRKDWPHDVKRKVLLELMKETPRQLLYKELWCASDGLTAFNAKLQRFCGTVAVMSIVGYILGLGDRHLDNILMDFNMGDIMHIDYNVCFEKGLRLKIPEIVPFRLTQSMQGALGLTGVEGAFRQSCEDVLQTLRTNKDTILMLLDVFAWDPLMEWTKSDGVNEGHLFGEEDKNGIETVTVCPYVQEHHTELQVSEAVLGSQEVRSQEVMMASEVAESSIAREHIGHLRDINENLDKSLDEHVLSQAEDDCWISPPNSGLDDESSSEKGNTNHLESFWLQSTDSLSGSRIWQSTLMSEYPKPKNSSMVVPDISTLGIEEQNDNNTSLPKLHSQGCANSDIEGSEVSKKMNQIDDDVFQPSMSPNGLPSQNSNGLIMGALLDLIDEPNNDKKSSQTRKNLCEIEKDYHTNASPLYSMAHRSRSKKNAYAVSVLERVEWKLDGLDNDGRRHFTVSEQVDYLLRQAMSIDNLCNMYEGWTPWI